MAYTDQNKKPGADAVWNNMLGKWMHPSGNPYDVWETQQGGGAAPSGRGTNPDSDDPWENGTADWPYWDPRGVAVSKEELEAEQAGKGYLQGVGTTVAPGRSITPEQAAQQRQAAIDAGIPESWVNDYLSRNPHDTNRLQEAWASQRSGGGDGGSGGGNPSVAQQWNTQPVRDPRLDEFYQQLLARSQQGLDVNRNDPAIRAQADAFAANQTRAQRNYISDTAERLGPYAGGALQGERRMAAERAGIASGAFEAELIGREVAARRDEIAQALQLMAGRLTTDQEVALRQELAQLDAVLQREGMGLQRELGFAGLGLQRYGLDLGFDRFLRELAQRQYEFDTGTDYNYWLNA